MKNVRICPRLCEKHKHKHSIGIVQSPSARSCTICNTFNLKDVENNIKKKQKHVAMCDMFRDMRRRLKNVQLHSYFPQKLH